MQIEDFEQEHVSKNSLQTDLNLEETYSRTLGYEGEAYHQKHGRDILHAPSGAKACWTFHEAAALTDEVHDELRLRQNLGRYSLEDHQPMYAKDLWQRSGQTNPRLEETYNTPLDGELLDHDDGASFLVLADLRKVDRNLC